ncbi:Imm49 family immunity protein [Herbaspirillum sp.]|uniref:hemagglutinin repeat-containing protein n=1 Tax=Herbaspirillum sp. TaxID=1890675 RepID=UPI0031E2C3D3
MVSNEVKLLAAQNTTEQHSSNKGISGSIDISIGTDGLMFNVGLSGSRGRGDGNDVTQVTVKNNSYTQFQQEFLADRQALIDEIKNEGEVPKAVQIINSGTGSLAGCLLALERYHANLAGYAWFENRDLHELKSQCYVVAKLMYIRAITENALGFKGITKIYYSLISDHDESIAWMSNSCPQSEHALHLTENPAKPEYFEYQMSLAIREDWHNLARRAEIFLGDVPPKQKRFSADMRFYLALAHGDRQKMSDALNEIVSPKMLKARKEDFGLHFPAQFISPLATLYAKIASRHGHIMELETPFIPNEWLPREALVDYIDPYPFMHAYKIGHATST